MKNKTLVRRPLSAMLALTLLMSFLALFANVQVSAATDRVSMYSISTYFSKYGMSSREIYVQTKDNASNQHVYIHYNYLDGEEWHDEEATYVTTLSDGSKIWKANFTSFNGKYAIRYEADGQVFWDNNNGNDYEYEKIGSAPIAVKRIGSQYRERGYEVDVVLKNFAYQKNVQIRYTTDNWATYTDAPMSFVSMNDDGTENWTGLADINYRLFGDIEYCVYYEVNGQTYWANNFGQNYDSGYRVHQ